MNKIQRAIVFRAVRLAAGSCLSILALSGGLLRAQTATVVGYPSNFDAVNNTGGETHGFEIEADGISSSDLTRIFGDNFIEPGGPCLIRYCMGTAVDFPGGVYIRWASPWDPNAGMFTQTTPVPNGTYVGGESCWTYGLGAAYPTAGCEHFGISSVGQPTQVIYRWLVADPQNPGQLIRYSAPAGSGFAPQPTPVPIPQPVINIIPPAQPGAQPVVDFEVRIPPPPPAPRLAAPQFGDAQWVKVYKNESPNEVDLNDLLVGNAAVPNDAQVETEWNLLQTNPNNANGGILHNQSVNGGSGKHAVVRRYVFYKYSGNYDAVTHEALCAGDETCTAPQPGELGDIIGDQIAAANIETPSVTVAKSGSGTVTGANGKINCGGTCTVNVTAGTIVSLLAITPGNAIFGGWTGACTGSDTNCSLTVSSSLNTTATFTPTFTLSVARGGSGAVTGTPLGAFGTFINCGGSCSAKFPLGTAVTLTATPAAGVKFVNWTGACSGTSPTCTLTISKDTSAQANFK
jgi:hypothetical protein